MENNEDKGKTPEEPKVTAPPSPPRKPSTSGKWIAVIIGLLVVIGVLGGLLATHYYVPPAAAGPTGPSAVISAQNATIDMGQSYTATINATGAFQNITVYFGDGTASKLVQYHQSNSVKVTHTYAQPGEYYILADINYSATNVGYFLQKVTVAPNLSNVQNGYRPWVVDHDASSSQLYSSISSIFAPGSSLQLDAGGFSNPNYVYQIVNQKLTLNNLSGVVTASTIPYYYNYGNGVYTAPVTTTSYSPLYSGMYMLNITTTTAQVNAPQTVKTSVSNTQTQTVYYMLANSQGNPYAFSASQAITGTGSQNVSFVMPRANLTYSMSDNASFQNGAIFTLASAGNFTMVSGTGYYVNATGAEIPISASTYTDVATGTAVHFNSTSQVMFNTAVSVYSSSAATTQSFTGSFTLGFNTPTTGVMIANNAPVTAPTTTVTYNAGTAFTTLNGTSLSTKGKTNVTFGQDTTVQFGTTQQVVLQSAANVTLNAGNLYNKNGKLTVNATTGTYYLNAGENYTFSSANATFNTAPTSMMLNSATNTLTLSGNNEPGMFTLVNKTAVTFSSAGSHTKVWTSLSVTSTLTGTGTVALTNGNYNPSKVYTTTYWEDFPITPKVSQEGGPSATTQFTNAEPNAPGGYTTLDPSIAYYTADSEILNNALLQLDTYNGTSTSDFVPLAAAYLPSLTNGGINTGYHNYTETTPWGTSYVVNESPGQNFTFYINNKIKFQDGSSLTAWDVMYTFTRTLLFDAASPGTGGWVNAQYLLPGDYFASNTFYNITNNITVNNASNSITFHFQTPMPASLVFQIFASSGTWIEPAAWFEAHGAGITWTASGFQAYQAQGNIADYNSYVQNHIMADGPYEISYIIPGSQVTMVKNPSFVQPNTSYYKPATIDRVNILYLSSNEQAFLLLKSGQATNAALPTSYTNQTNAMVQSGFLQKHGFPTLGLYFYTFTMNTNLSILHTVTSLANIPSNLFMNPNVRKAFAYAYNYSLYYNRQVGNQIYNETFLSPYAGMMPPGMLYAQSLSDLAAKNAQVINGGNGLQPFQKAMAQKFWSIFMNDSKSATDGPAAMGLTLSNGKVMYKGNPLSIPIMIPNSDPTDKAAVTTWASDIAQVIPGASAFPVELPLTDIFAAYSIPGQNPMAISWGGWAPDYPYPTDYLLPMGMPLNSSTYMGPAGYTPYVVGNTSASVYNTSEAAFMQTELSALNNATNNATNPTLNKYWFQVANGMIVNSTIEVYIGQQYLHWVMSSKINGNDIVKYQENVMIGGGQDLQYNLLSFNTTS